ncbi:MAG: DUF2752 domain-containing protein [Candidatus Kapabacteria bacterium]|nr:DUF2752 domain-containing protein [Candidatus Kapabacteria bacterium]
MQSDLPLIPRPKLHRTALIEALTWAVGLTGLAIWGADLHGHATVCVPTLLGIDGCIGCGVGHAAGLALRGDVVGSVSAHPLGVVAVVVLLLRIATVIRSHHRFAGGKRG